jgi:hypothetical protein
VLVVSMALLLTPDSACRRRCSPNCAVFAKTTEGAARRVSLSVPASACFF